MIINKNSYSIVLVGAWNKALMSPSWLAKNLFDDNPQPQVEFSLNLDAPFRFRVKNITIAPSSDKVIFLSNDYSDDSLKLMESTAIRLCEILKHTPLIALGINFGFTEKENKDELFKLFEISDKSSISENGWVISQPLIKRTLVKDNYFTNLSISIDKDSDFCFVFNFHYNVTETNNVSELILNKVLDYKNQALSLLESLYNLKLDANV